MHHGEGKYVLEILHLKLGDMPQVMMAEKNIKDEESVGNDPQI